MKLSRNPSQNRNFQQAIQYHQAGRWEAAKATYNTVIRLEPGNFRALNNLGLILLGEGNSDAAKALFEQSATQDPNYPEALNNLGNLHRSRGDFDASQVYFERARRANPAHVPTHINLGLLFESCGKLDHAIDCYRDGLRINPNLREGHLNLGSALQRSGLADEAIVCYQKAAELDPNYAEPLNNLGTLFQSRGDFDTALAYFEKAIQANPQYGITHINLGRLFESYGKLDRAIACYRNGLQIIPNSPEGHLNLGNALQRSVQIDQAIACYQQAIALQPDFPIAYANLGAALQAQGKVTPAMAALQQALRLQPDQIDALLNLGNVMTALGRIDEATECYERILALQPAHAGALSNQLLALNYADSISPPELAQRSFKAGAQIQQNLPATRSGTDPQPGKRLRVGYVSPDFRGHAVAYFLEPLMRAHDRAEVEVFCYAEVSVPDRVTARFQSLADHWRWTVGVGDEELAAQIRADDIDILIDVAGHSANNRLPVFARRPAPVQVTWLGYPNTTGLASIDYRLIDAITDPPGAADKLAAETLLRIDGGFLCYQPPDDAPEPAPFADAGFITFGSFNNLAKLSDTTLQVWGRLLAMVPNARLLLKSARFQEQEPKTQIMARLNQHGIATDRVILLGASKHAADQLAAYRHVDIALDPFPYNGTTTTCETLWMGVPVVTLLGDSHRSRVGASLLTGIGCTGLIAHDHDDYIRIAAELAADPIRLQALRHQLRPRMAASNLCDAPAFARKIEAVYRTAWQTWCACERGNELCVRLSDGTRLLVPPSLQAITTYVVLEQERWFEKEAEFVAHWLKPGMTAIDIGANLGIYSIPMARLVAPDGHVFAYEPAADTCALLARNGIINNAANLVVTRAAMSDHTGVGNLAHGTSSELNQLSPDSAGHSAGESVKITCLDDEDQKRDWTSPDLVKIDAEGEENAILRGGKTFFARHSPLIMFEVSNEAPNQPTPRSTLKALGYNLFRLLPGAPVLVPHLDDHLDAYELNLFAAKPDRAAVMAREGWLVENLPKWTPDDRAREQALQPLRQLCCAPAFADLLGKDLDPDYLDCLAAFSVWRSPGNPLPLRCAALDFSWRGLLALNQRTTTFARVLTLARVAAEAGQRAVSVMALRHFLAETRRAEFAVNEPFWPASARFDNLLPDADTKSWIIGSAAEQLELSGHFSSIFTGTTPELEWLHTQSFASTEMVRRRMLQALRSGQPADIPCQLRCSDQDHVNAELWRSGKVVSLGAGQSVAPQPPDAGPRAQPSRSPAPSPNH